jgi:hypothetical protein
MIYKYRQSEVRRYLRQDRKTLRQEIVSVSNRYNLSVERHMELLNLNDDTYEYIAYLGNTHI